VKSIARNSKNMLLYSEKATCFWYLSVTLLTIINFGFSANFNRIFNVLELRRTSLKFSFADLNFWIKPDPLILATFASIFLFCNKNACISTF